MLTLLLLLLPQKPDVQTFVVDGVERRALLCMPTVKSPRSPLVLAFHGHGGGMNQARLSFKIDSLWPDALVIYPEGLPTPSPRVDPDGKRRGWQNSPGTFSDRDLHFVDAILARVRKDYQVDEHRIYAMGHSNGGRFTAVLWAKRGNQFAAFSISGAPATGLIRDFKPRSAFVIAGEKDQIVPYAGQKLSIELLERALSLDDARTVDKDGVKYIPGKDGLELALMVHPGGHEYPASAPSKIVEFFKRHPKE